MKPARVALTLVVLGLAACGGGGGSLTGGPHGASIAPAQTTATGTPAPSTATATQTYTSAATKLTFPSVAGYSGTAALPVSGMLGAATMTMTSSTTIPAGVPTYLDHRRASGERHVLSSVVAPQFYETLNSSDTVVFTAFPVLSFTVPSTINTSTSAFYVASYDPIAGGPWTELGRTGVPYHQTVAIGVSGTTLSMKGNVNYVFGLYSLPLESPTSSFAASACPNPAVSAVSANNILWCASGLGFEKIAPSGSSFVSANGLTVDGMTRGPDGNVWFTAQATSPVAGQLAVYGKVDQTSGVVTTYQIPNPSTYPTSTAVFQAGSISAGPSSLYFVASATVNGLTQGFVETADTSGGVTQSVQISYRPAPGFAALTYTSDGNVWLFAESSVSGYEQYVTKVSLPAGTTTNYQVPGCPAVSYPANLVQGGDGNLYIQAWDAGTLSGRGVCTITLAGIATYTPIAPYLEPLFDLVVATDGSVWFADQKGVGRISNGAITQYADPVLHDVSAGVFALPNGTLWEIGTFPSAVGVQVLNPGSP